MLTDGIISDMPQTKEAVVNVSDWYFDDRGSLGCGRRGPGRGLFFIF